MMELNYLKRWKDQHKYDHVSSTLCWGKHPVKPMFSIVIPTYRRPGYLYQSLLSAVGQVGVDDYEIVIVDNDGSEREVNETLEVVKAVHSHKVVYYQNAENIGIYGNTLRAAHLARGQYAVLLNDDDLLHPYYLQVVSLFMEQHHYYGMIGIMPSEFQKEDYEYQKLPDEIAAYQISKIEYFFGCCVTSPGMLWPVKETDKIWNAYEELLMGDQIIQYKTLENYGLYFINFPLALYRIGENETLKEDRLLKMTYHMCRFKIQISKRNFFLKCFMWFFQKEYLYWYIHSSLQFWKKRGMENKLLKILHLKRPAKYSVRYFLTERMIGQVHLYYIKNNHKKLDKISLHDKRLDELVYDGEKRSRFLELLRDYPFEKAYVYAKHNRYDIALLGRWNMMDYGEVMSAAALYETLKQSGNEVLIVDGMYPEQEKIPSYFRENCMVSRRYQNLDECFELNGLCGNFIVKCNDADIRDQKFYNLRFLESGKNRIFCDQLELDTDIVAESVFLQPAGFYIGNAQKSCKKMTNPFAFFYLLNVEETTDDVLRQMQEKTGLESVVYIGRKAENPSGMILNHVVYGLTIYDFLAYIYRSDYFITDSFYGVCLALVLHKPFGVFLHGRGEDARTEKLLCSLGCEDRVISRTAPIFHKQDPDWIKTDRKLQEYRELLKVWLEEQLFKRQGKGEEVKQ